METYAKRYIEGKQYTQDNLIPLIILILGNKGGKATKNCVEQKIYDLLQNEFSKDLYHEIVARNVPRWKHDIAWARERAKQIHDYIKPPEESGRGTWELTSTGKKYYEELLVELRKVKE
jgi:hypothetical protein